MKERQKKEDEKESNKRRKQGAESGNGGKALRKRRTSIKRNKLKRKAKIPRQKERKNEDRMTND